MKNKINILIIICISFLLSFKVMRPGMWSVQDDMHTFRLSEYDLCQKSGQIPCRYSPNSAFGFGSPVFNFYPPTVYKLGTIFHLLGFSYINSLKIIYLLPLFFGPIFMYLFASIYFGTNSGLVSAVVFATAPYQALNIFVRGAIAENFGLNLIPVIFYFYAKKQSKISIILITVLFLTHQLTTLIALSLLILFSLSTNSFKRLFTNIIWSLGLSAFFILPSIFEKNLTTNFMMTQGYFNYIIHFATLKQLFIDRFWGFGASLWGPKDDMSFQIGYIQWILPLIITIYSLWNKSKHIIIISSTFILGLFFTFLTHNKSTFIWQLFPFMDYFQFPWRFLGAVILCFSFLSGSMIISIPKRFQVMSLFFILTILLLLNYNYFRIDQWTNINDQQKLSGQNLIAAQGAGLTDFYPKYSHTFPTVETPAVMQTILGTTGNVSFTKNYQITYGQITVKSDMAIMNLPVAYFPNMELRLDTQKISYRIEPNLGLVQFDVPTGTHHFYLQFKNTPIRTISNYISLLFAIAFIIKLIRDQK